MRIATWNIKFGLDIGNAISELQSIEELQGLDVLLLQEMDEGGTAAIADALDASYAYASAAPHQRTGRDFGNAVISPWPIRNSAEIPLPHESTLRGQPRSATHATVGINRIDVSVYSVHTEVMTLRLPRRVEQFRAIAADVDDRAAPQVVVGGDFNTVSPRSIAALDGSMAVAGLTNVAVLAGPSYRRGGRDLTLDHIFAGGLTARSAGVCFAADVSDHFPVWVELDRELSSCSE